MGISMQSVVKSSCVFAAIVCAPAASAFNLTLAQLNGGPSSASIPTSDNSVVATFLYPREVVNTNVSTTLSGTLDGGAGANSSLTVETASGGGVRHRSRAVVPNFAQYDNDGALHLVAHLDADVDADSAGSFILLVRSSDIDAIGSTIADLMDHISDLGFEGVTYVTLAFAGAPALDADSKVTATALASGVSIPFTQFWDVDPDGAGPLNANNYRFNSALNTFLVAMDTDSDGVPNVVTEWGCIQRNGTPAVALHASTGPSPTFIPEIRVLARQQLVDDSAENPGDTLPSQLSAAVDLRVASSGAGNGAESLQSFLDGLPGGPYAAAITVGGETDGDFNRVIHIDLVPDVTNAAAIETIRSRFIGFTPGAANGTGGRIATITGGFAQGPFFAQMGTSEFDMTLGLADDDIWVSPLASDPAFNPVLSVWGANGLDLNPAGFPGPPPTDMLWSHAYIAWDVPALAPQFRWGGATMTLELASDTWEFPAGDVYIRFLDRGFGEETWDIIDSTPAPLPKLGRITGNEAGASDAGDVITFEIPASIPAQIIYEWLVGGQIYLAVTADAGEPPPTLTNALQVYSANDPQQRGPRLVLHPGRLGDVNGDGLVDFADLNIVLGNFNVVADGLEGDLNRDGRVDFADLNEVVSFFNVAKGAR